jgi:hypothetical protein
MINQTNDISENYGAQQLTCPKCGGTFAFGKNNRPKRCFLCTTDLSSSAVDGAQINPSQFKGNLVRNKITRQQMDEAIGDWLITGDYTPDDILANSTFLDAFLVYFPLYVYSSSYEGTWTAQSGFDRQETYTETVGDSYTDHKGNVVGGSHQEQRTRTVTDWKPSSGTIKGVYEVTGSATKLQLIPTSHKFIEAAGRTNLQPIQDANLEEAVFEAFELSANDVWEKRGKENARASITQAIAKYIPGNYWKNLQWKLTYGDQRRSQIYLPYWIARYIYNGTNYFVFVDGQRVSRVWGGKPETNDRKRTAEILSLGPGILGIAIALILIFRVARLPDASNFFAAFFIAIGVVSLLFFLGSKAKKMYLARTLARRQASLQSRKQNNPTLFS